MSQWYYADAGVQQGPVAAAALAALYQQGRISDATLIWREGLAEWQALSMHHAELGITEVMPPPTPPSAAPSKKTNGCLIAALVVFAAGIVVFGILMAVAIPAFQNYSVQEKVGESLYEANLAKLAVTEFYANTGRCPRDWAEAGTTEPQGSYLEGARLDNDEQGRCRIELTLIMTDSEIAAGGQRIWLVLDIADLGQWTCSSDIGSNYLPNYCR